MRKYVLYAIGALVLLTVLLVVLVGSCQTSGRDPNREEAYEEQTGQEADDIEEDPEPAGTTGQQGAGPPRN